MPGHDGTRLRFRCGCGAKISAPASAAGRRARCPNCGAVIVLRADAAVAPRPTKVAPAPGGRIKFACACHARLAVPADRAGKKVKCPKCGQIAIVPRRAPTPAQAVLESPVGADDLLEGLAKGENVAVGPPPVPGGSPAAPTPVDDFLRLSSVDQHAKSPEARAVPAGPAQTCPSCGKSLPSSVIICVDCGINIKSGRALLTSQEDNLDRAYVYAERAVRWISWLVPIGVYPVASEAFGLRTPWTVRLATIATVLISIWFMFAVIYNPDPAPDHLNLMHWIGRPPHPALDRPDPQTRDPFAGSSPDDQGGETDPERPTFRIEAAPLPVEYRPHQLLTSAFLHGGWLHLAGNMLFLMVLGSRVNALIGNLLTAILYPLLAIISAVAQMVAMRDGPWCPCLGASGVVMGLAGMYLVLFPVHKVHMAAWWRLGLAAFFRLSYTIFPVRGFFVVLFYIAFDVLFIVLKLDDNVGHWAHVGGFAAGVLIALLLLFARLVNARGGDLISAVLGRYAWYLIGKPSRRCLNLW